MRMSFPFVWILATLASYRLWRLLAFDDVLAGPRLMVVERLPRNYEGAIYCPWCLGFWSCVLTFVLIDLTGYSVPLPVVQVAAASTLVGWLGSRLET